MNIISIIIIIGIVNGILEGIALLVFMHRGNRRANRILGFLVIILSFCVSGMLIMSLRSYIEYPHLLLITQPFLFLIGPLFWLYVQLVTHRIDTFQPRLLYHAVPFILCLLYRAPFYIMSAADKAAIFEQWSSQSIRSDLLVTGIQLTHIVIYLIFVLRQVRIHQSAIRKEYSSIEKINLTWVRIFVISICIVAVVMALFLLLDLFGFQSFVHTTSGLLGILLPLGLGYYGLRQPEIFLGLIEPVEIQKKYERSALTPEKADHYMKQLIAIMDNERPYHNSSLTIHDLADKLSIPVHYLSQVINDRLQQNFYDFVNRYRVDEVKRQLADPSSQKYTLMAVALNAGFNSKSVFNTAFRKYTGVTPSEYRRNISED
jgi:AraC-like DNA-binding protein